LRQSSAHGSVRRILIPAPADFNAQAEHKNVSLDFPHKRKIKGNYIRQDAKQVINHHILLFLSGLGKLFEK